MANHVRLTPVAITQQTGLTGLVTAIREDPTGTPDSSWLTAAVNTATTLVTTFSPPSNVAGLQTVRVRVRKTAQSGNPTVRVEVLSNGVLVATAIPTTTVTTANPGVALSGTYNASLVTGPLSLRVVGTPPTSGSGGTRSSLEIGSIDIQAELAVVPIITYWNGTTELPTITSGVTDANGNIIPAALELVQ